MCGLLHFNASLREIGCRAVKLKGPRFTYHILNCLRMYSSKGGKWELPLNALKSKTDTLPLAQQVSPFNHEVLTTIDKTLILHKGTQHSIGEMFSKTFKSQVEGGSELTELLSKDSWTFEMMLLWAPTDDQKGASYD